MFEHTPGPWIYRRVGIGSFIVDGQGNVLASTSTHPLPQNEEPNFKLMAAAPDLLEAVKAMVTAISFPLTNKELVAYDLMLKALAKARGADEQ